MISIKIIASKLPIGASLGGTIYIYLYQKLFNNLILSLMK